jgi:hypothetical protein
MQNSGLKVHLHEIFLFKMVLPNETMWAAMNTHSECPVVDLVYSVHSVYK